MKTLKNLTYLSLILLLTVFAACKKDKSEQPSKGSYTLGSRTVKTTKADYTLDKGVTPKDDRFYLFIYGDQPTDIIQFIFPSSGIPADGTYYYEPGANGRPSFKGGSVTDAAHPESSYINAGSVTVTKTGDGYTISFSVTAVAGTAKGSYTGSLVSR